jgi:hypothetical protein
MAHRSILASRTNELKRSVSEPPGANVPAQPDPEPDDAGVSPVVSDLLTPKECADYRRCSLRTLDRERAEARGPPFAQIGARVFYRRKDVDLFIAAHVREPRATGSDGELTARASRRPPKITGGAGDVSDTPRRRTLPSQCDEIGRLEDAEAPDTLLGRTCTKSPAKRVHR